MSGAAYRPVSAGIARTILDADTCSLKRLAWAYGCAPKGSTAEIQLEMLLLQRAAAEVNEMACTFAAISNEAIVQDAELRARIMDLEIRLAALNKAPGEGVGP